MLSNPPSITQMSEQEQDCPLGEFTTLEDIDSSNNIHPLHQPSRSTLPPDGWEKNNIVDK